MAEKSTEERTEAPTPKRIKDLRKKNTVLRSTELVTTAGLVALVAMAPMLIYGMWVAGVDAVRASFIAASAPSVPEAFEQMISAFTLFLNASIVPVSVVLLSVMVASVVFTRGRPNIYAIKPRFDYLNPKQGVKRVLGVQGVVEAAKGLVKVLAVAVAALTILPAAYSILIEGPPSLEDFFAEIGRFASDLSWRLVIVALLVAAFDVWWSRRRYLKQARMTKTEVRQEFKSTEGDPLIKAARRQRAAQLARQRMMEEVSTATVVLTNPTHIAIALRYADGDFAPVVVARGAGVLAAKIKEKAAAANIPVRENKPLARVLYKGCKVGDIIPADLYQAVAVVLAEVMRKRRRTVRR